MSSISNFTHTLIIFLVLCEIMLNTKSLLTSPHHESSTSNLSTLKQVHVIFRHGISVPENEVLDSFEYYIEDLPWPAERGELTSDGKYYQLKLAEYLRKRYSGFISLDYVEDEIMIISSDSVSCSESLEIILKGLYPQYSNPNSKRRFHTFETTLAEINNQHTISHEDDNILKMSKSCSKWEELYSNVKVELVQDKFKLLNGSSIYIEEDGEMNLENITNYISHHSGLDGTNVDDIRKLHTILTTQKLCNITLPVWAPPLLQSQAFDDLVKLSYNVLTHTEEMKKLKGGPLLKILVDHFYKQNEKLFIYSGHAATVASLLNIFSSFETQFLDYSGALIIELHEETKNSHVHMLYRGEMEETETFIEIYKDIHKRCTGNYCVYDLIDFENFCNHYAVENYADECKIAFISIWDFPFKEILSAVFLMAIFPILLFIFVKILYYKRRNDELSPLLQTHKVF